MLICDRFMIERLTARDRTVAPTRTLGIVDVLSEWLTRTRTAPARSARTRLRGPFGVRFTGDGVLAFHVVLEGTMWIRSTSGMQRLDQGDVVVLPRGGAHDLCDDPSTPVVDFEAVAPAAQSGAVQPELTLGSGQPQRTLLCAWFAFDTATSNPVLDALPDVVHVPGPSGGSGLRATIGLLSDEVTHAGRGAQAVVDALSNVVLVQAIRSAADHDASVCPSCWFDGLDDPVTAAALTLVHERPADPWTVASLAGAVGMSRAAFARRFKHRVGEPPASYLTRWRMTLAAERLRTTRDPLDTIARSVGYESGVALSRALKRVGGRTPTQVRRMPTGGNDGVTGAASSAPRAQRDAQATVGDGRLRD